MDNTIIKAGYMLIYVNTENYKDWSNSADVVWDTIPVEVEVGFSAMGKYYDPASKMWIEDVIPELTIEEINQLVKTELTHLIAQKEQELLIANLRGKDISTILKDLDDLEKELAEYD